MSPNPASPGTSGASVRPSTLLLFLVLWIGAVPGILPFAIFLESPTFFAVYLLVAAIVVGIVCVRRSFPEGPIPRPGEYLQASAAMAAMHAAGGMYGFAIYGAVIGLIRLFFLVAGYFEWSIAPIDADRYAFPFSVFSSAVIGVAAPLGNVPKALYGQGVGTGGPFRSLTARHHAMAIGGVVGGVLLSLGMFVLGKSDVWQIFPAYLIAAAGMKALNTSLPWSASAAFDRDAASAVERLYQALDYKTIMRPRPKQDDEKLTWLLERLTLLASREDEILAIVVLTPASGRAPAVPADVSLLPGVARGLSRSLAEDGQHSVDVQPVLFLIGREASPQLVEFAREERIRLVCSLSHDDLRTALAASDVADLRVQARQHLQPELRVENATPAQAVG